MNLFTSIIATTLFFLSTASQAVPMTFMSGNDDNCKRCTLSEQVGTSYVAPSASNGLEDASWVQADGSWDVVDDYRVWESDLDNNGMQNYITSLFVAFDDKLVIKSDGDVLFDSADYNINRPWANVTNIIDLTGELFVAGNKRLNFYVDNIGGPTGIIWRGTVATTPTTTGVPAPATIALFLFALCGLIVARKSK